jgi:hypothetical protein
VLLPEPIVEIGFVELSVDLPHRQEGSRRKMYSDVPPKLIRKLARFVQTTGARGSHDRTHRRGDTNSGLGFAHRRETTGRLSETRARHAAEGREARDEAMPTRKGYSNETKKDCVDPRQQADRHESAC